MAHNISAGKGNPIEGAEPVGEFRGKFKDGGGGNGNVANSDAGNANVPSIPSPASQPQQVQSIGTGEDRSSPVISSTAASASGAETEAAPAAAGMATVAPVDTSALWNDTMIGPDSATAVRNGREVQVDKFSGRRWRDSDERELNELENIKTAADAALTAIDNREYQGPEELESLKRTYDAFYGGKGKNVRKFGKLNKRRQKNQDELRRWDLTTKPSAEKDRRAARSAMEFSSMGLQPPRDARAYLAMRAIDIDESTGAVRIKGKLSYYLQYDRSYGGYKVVLPEIYEASNEIDTMFDRLDERVSIMLESGETAIARDELESISTAIYDVIERIDGHRKQKSVLMDLAESRLRSLSAAIPVEPTTESPTDEELEAMLEETERIAEDSYGLDDTIDDPLVEEIEDAVNAEGAETEEEEEEEEEEDPLRSRGYVPDSRNRTEVAEDYVADAYARRAAMENSFEPRETEDESMETDSYGFNSPSAGLNQEAAETTDVANDGEEAQVFVDDTAYPEGSGIYAPLKLSNKEAEKLDDLTPREKNKKLFKKHKRAGEKSGESKVYDDQARTYADEVLDRMTVEVNDEGAVSFHGFSIEFFKRIRNNIALLFNPTVIRIEGVKYNVEKYEDGYYSIPDLGKAGEAIQKVMNLYGVTFKTAMRMVICYSGIGYDIHGRICKKSINEFQLTQEQVIEICNSILISSKIVDKEAGFANPFRLVPAAPSKIRTGLHNEFIMIGGTPCFPVFHIPRFMFEELSASENSPLHGVSWEDFNASMQQIWEGSTRPAIIAQAELRKDADDTQMRSLIHLSYAYEFIDDRSAEHVEYRLLREQLRSDEVFEKKLVFADDPALQAAAEARSKSAEAFLAWNMKRYEGAKNKEYQRFLHALCRLICITGTANPLILLSGMVEYAESRVEMRTAQAFQSHKLKSIYKRNPEIADMFSLDQELEDMLGDDWYEAYQVISALHVMDGWNGIIRFFSTKKPTVTNADGSVSGGGEYKLTKQDLQEFLNNEVYHSEEGKANQKLDRLADYMRKLMYGQMPGQKNEAIDFMRNVLYHSAVLYDINKQRAAEQGNVDENSVNASIEQNIGLESVFTVDGLKKNLSMSGNSASEVIKSMICTPNGRDAFLVSGSMAYSRKSPLQQGLNRALNKNGATEFGLRLLFDRYMEYSLNKLLLLTPFSLTAGYLVSTGFIKVRDMQFDAVDTTEQAQLPGWVNRTNSYQLGMNMATEAMKTNGTADLRHMSEFWMGLRRCLLYDSMKLMGKGSIALLMFLLYSVFHIGPPPDDRDRYNPDEWTIDLSPIGGPKDQPIKEQWWADDFFGYGYPVGLGLAIAFRDGWPTTTTMREAWNTMVNAWGMQTEGDFFVESLQFVTHIPENIDAIINGEIDISEIPGQLLQKYLARLCQYFTPTVINQFIPGLRSFLFHRYGELDHTASVTYDWYGNEVPVDDPMLEQRLFLSQDNILYAVSNALVDRAIGGKYNNAWLWKNQPLKNILDPYALEMSTYYKTDVSLAPTDYEELQEWCLARGQRFYRDMQQYTSPLEAAEAGVYVDGRTLALAANFCEYNSKRLTDAYWAIPEGQRPDWGEYYDLFIREYDEWAELWVYNNDGVLKDIPQYYEVIGDRSTRYTSDNGDNPANWLEYTIGMDGVGKERYHYGNSSTGLSNFSPFIMPMHDLPWIGWNDETIPLGIYATPEAMYENMDGMDFTRSKAWGGKNARETYFGGAGSNDAGLDEDLQIPTDGSVDPTLSRRGLVPAIPDNLATTQYGAYLEQEIPGFRSCLSGGTFDWGDSEHGGGPKSVAEVAAGRAAKGQGNKPGLVTINDVTIPSGIPPTSAAEMRQHMDAAREKAKEAYDNLSEKQKEVLNLTIDTIEGIANPAALDYDEYADVLEDPEYLDYIENYITDGNIANWYPGYRTYRGGGGGSRSSSSPKIYSNARNVNADRAEGLNTRSPYKATNTYLRPQFATKGSREAYRRQDI